MENLITVPTFNFSQGDTVIDGAENPIQVCYYNNMDDEPLIELTQEGRHINFTNFSQLEKLVKNIRKNLNEAKHKLNK